MSESFTLDVPVTLQFEGNSVFVAVKNVRCDLLQLANIDELRVLLFSIASGAIENLATGSAAAVLKESSPSTGSAAEILAGAFQRQADRGKADIQAAKETYEAAVAQHQR